MTAPFLVDSNFFIQAHRMHYPIDVVPGFWMKIKELATKGVILSIDKVRDELLLNKDDLSIWCEENLDKVFFKNTDEVINEYIRVTTWANSKKNHYKTTALNEFLEASEADAWLVACALKDTCKIVTHEVSQPDGKKKIKIPDAAQPFNIACVNTIEMFRLLGEQF
ncbi:MAG TPA: DUF4411 family protein [Pelobium sp.]|nr:DUF4411 family protein [Pelobium sp.]